MLPKITNYKKNTIYGWQNRRSELNYSPLMAKERFFAAHVLVAIHVSGGFLFIASIFHYTTHVTVLWEFNAEL